MVYVIQCTVTGRVKVGKASNPIDRLMGLQCGSPTLLRLLAMFDGDEAEERAVHERLAGSRLHGEWFDLSESVVAFLAEHGINAHAPNPGESIKKFEGYRVALGGERAEWRRLIAEGEDPEWLEKHFYRITDAWAELVNAVHMCFDRWEPVEYEHSLTNERLHVSGGLWQDHEAAMIALRPSREVALKRQQERMERAVFSSAPEQPCT